MHDLKGVITGLSTDPERAAPSWQLDAQVDSYGSAKIGGQLSLLRPEQLTEIEMTFRNLEMTSLSPYVVKFAGYRIAGGRLALDLQYQVRDRKLHGREQDRAQASSSWARRSTARMRSTCRWNSRWPS